MKVTIVLATTTEQRQACTELLEADPELWYLDTDDFTLWAALDEDGNIVGMAGATFEPDSRHAELQCCVVSPTARGQGIQKRLLRTRIAWARKQGAVSLETYAHRDNLPSLISLMSCGFRPKDLVDEFLTVEYPLE